jgi:hypothetical protein
MVIRTAIAITLLLAGCASGPAVKAPTSDTAPASAAAATAEEPSDAPDGEKTYHMVIRFISIGGGTDGEAEAKLNDIIKEYPRTSILRRHWGKEGEENVCLDLAELEESARADLIGKIDGALSGNERVQIARDQACSVP